MEADLPLRRRLVVRLLAGAVLIALVAIAATAWLASRTTTDAIRRAQDRSLAAETRIYDALVRFAATHRSWHGVAATVTRLEAATGRHIVLTDRERAVLGLVGEALNDKQIAERLKISAETVEKHRFNIRRKLDLKDYADIARYAREHGFTLVAPKTGGDVMLP